MADNSKPKFAIGDRVMVAYIDKYYPAKVLKQEKKDNEWKYLLHYLGWNKNWDEIVEEKGIVPYKPDIEQIQQSKKQNSMSGKSKRYANDTQLSNKQGRNKVAKRVPTLSDIQLKKQSDKDEMILAIPTVIKREVMEDWEKVTVKDELYSLPREPNVNTVLNSYLQHVQSTQKSIQQEQEVVNGIRIYFDTCIENLLLYDKERPQAKEILSSNILASTYYGPEHLMRLLVRIFDFLQWKDLSEIQINVIKLILQDLLKWLAINYSQIFPESAFAEQLVKPQQGTTSA